MMDMSAVLVLHPARAEPRASLASLRTAVDAAAAHGLSVEMIVALARGATADSALLAGMAGLRVIVSGDDGEPGARNAAVAAAQGRFMAFLGSDDLWGADWLRAACLAARDAKRKTVWHPEAILHYGDDGPAWALQPDVETSPGDWVTLAMQDHWAASSFAARDIHLEVPYATRDWAWTWNAAVVAAGCLHRAVEGTAHLSRRAPPQRAIAPEAASLWRNRVGWGYRVGLLGRGAG